MLSATAESSFGVVAASTPGAVSAIAPRAAAAAIIALIVSPPLSAIGRATTISDGGRTSAWFGARSEFGDVSGSSRPQPPGGWRLT